MEYFSLQSNNMPECESICLFVNVFLKSLRVLYIDFLYVHNIGINHDF